MPLSACVIGAGNTRCAKSTVFHAVPGPRRVWSDERAASVRGTRQAGLAGGSDEALAKKHNAPAWDIEDLLVNWTLDKPNSTRRSSSVT